MFRIDNNCISSPVKLSHHPCLSTPALDLWETQRGVSNVFLTYFGNFCGGGSIQKGGGGVERPNRGRG